MGTRPRSDAVVAITAICIPLITFSVAGRLWVRGALQKNNLGIDDALIVAGLFFTIAELAVVNFAYDDFGIGEHMDSLSVQVRVKSQWIFLLGEMLYLFSTGCTKLSILFFYRRFARTSLSKPFMWDVYVMIALQLAYMISGVIILPLQCQPTSSIWNQFDPTWAAIHDFNCINRWAFTTLGSVMSVMQDLAAFLLPLPLVWSLATSRLHKIGATAIFAGGLAVTIVGAVRVWFAIYLWRPDADNTYWFYALSVTGVLEPCLGIICCSLPALRMLFNKDLQARNRRLFRGLLAGGLAGYGNEFSRVRHDNDHHDSNPLSKSKRSSKNTDVSSDMTFGEMLEQEKTSISQTFEIPSPLSEILPSPDMPMTPYPESLPSPLSFNMPQEEDMMRASFASRKKSRLFSTGPVIIPQF